MAVITNINIRVCNSCVEPRRYARLMLPAKPIEPFAKAKPKAKPSSRRKNSDDVSRNSAPNKIDKIAIALPSMACFLFT